MSLLDWVVLGATLLLVISYGIWKSGTQKNIKSYLLADKKMPWYHVALSVMATQASAITFLSLPGLAYLKGMKFIQFYFGLPFAIFVVCYTFIPIFQKLNVYTAYQFLENRFDKRMRYLTSFLFLLQRGLSTGISIYAPSIVLSTLLKIDTTYTIFFMGSLVVGYTFWGGAKAVSHTQFLQMFIIFFSMGLVVYLILTKIPFSLSEMITLATHMQKTELISTDFDLKNEYTIWSGLIGGFFLQLSYFGTDQSQVGRYLTSPSVKESRIGLAINGIIKIPMQMSIMIVGILVLIFYTIVSEPPLFFNELALQNSHIQTQKINHLQEQFSKTHAKTKQLAEEVLHSTDTKKIIDFQQSFGEKERIHQEVSTLLKKEQKAEDKNYIFVRFIFTELPKGFIGLLIATLFLAAMGSLSAGLNSLASSTVIDIFPLFFPNQKTESKLWFSKLSTFLWGIFCIGAAYFASQLGNLIEAVNILGSLFYGVILGIFLVGFYFKKVGAISVFWASVLSEILILIFYTSDTVAFLWLNSMGCLAVIGLSFIFEEFKKVPISVKV